MKGVLQVNNFVKHNKVLYPIMRNIIADYDSYIVILQYYYQNPIHIQYFNFVNICADIKKKILIVYSVWILIALVILVKS